MTQANQKDEKRLIIHNLPFTVRFSLLVLLGCLSACFACAVLSALQASENEVRSLFAEYGEIFS